MAEETKKIGAKKAVVKKESDFVSKKEFNELSEMISGLVNLVTPIVKANAEVKANTPETPLEKEVTKAGPASEPVNPEWNDVAREIIGDALERCEVKHLRSGGLLFTVVIKQEFSNAPDNYLKEHKEDRRTKEIAAEGIGGVENWCKLVKQNLARPKIKQITN